MFVTRTRTAVVVPAALGLDDQPVRFTVEENAQPHWDRRLHVGVPWSVSLVGKR